MERLHTIPFWRSLGSALILALILLSSPCSVRNHLERFLEVEQTEVSNKSKTTACISYPDQSAFFYELSEVTSYEYFLVPHAFSVTSVLSSQRNFSSHYYAYTKNPPSVPYYILYGNSKYHL